MLRLPLLTSRALVRRKTCHCFFSGYIHTLCAAKKLEASGHASSITEKSYLHSVENAPQTSQSLFRSSPTLSVISGLHLRLPQRKWIEAVFKSAGEVCTSDEASNREGSRTVVENDSGRRDVLSYFDALVQLEAEEQKRLWDYAMERTRTFVNHDVLARYVYFLRIMIGTFARVNIFPEDVPCSYFFSRLRTALERNEPSCFFDSEFIVSLQTTLYGNRRVPIPRDAATLASASPASLESRQKLVERVTWRLNLKHVTEEMLLKHPQRRLRYGHLLPSWIDALAVKLAMERKQSPKTDALLLPLRSNEIAVVAMTAFADYVMRYQKVQEDLNANGRSTGSAQPESLPWRSNHCSKNAARSDDSGSAGDSKFDLAANNILATSTETLSKEPMASVVPASGLVGHIARTLRVYIRNKVTESSGNHSEMSGRASNRATSGAKCIGDAESENLQKCTEEDHIKVAATLVDKILRVTYIQVPRNEAENVVAMRELYSCKTQQAGSKASALANSLFETQMSKTSPIAPGSKTLQGSIIHFSDAVRSAHLPAAVVPDTADLSGAVPSTVWVRAFLHYTVQKSAKRRLGVICMPELTRAALQSSEWVRLLKENPVPYQPMITPPLPWNPAENRGAYHLDPPRFVRTTAWSHEFRQRFAGNTEPLQALAATLTRLGQVPWRIYSPTLEVIEQLWERGGDVAGLPKSCLAPLPQSVKDDEESDKREFWRSYYKTVSQNKRLTSEIPTFLLRLNTARAFNGVPRLYFPHSLDFRGRAYPVSPHLNHQGCDLARSLLVFAESKRLGPRGLRWLKIHVAGLFGHDKKLFEEREAWTNKHLEMCCSVAKNPLSEVAMNFWCSAEHPWQALTACFELGRIYASESPEDVCSPLPIHQDGTCNGLQHYAALGRDVEGALSVNLCANASPADVYTAVMREAQKRIERLAASVTSLETTEASPPSSSCATLAQFVLDNHLLVRKVVKTTVMTICYGVTQYGANLQVEKHLLAQHGTLFDSTPELARPLARLIASTIIQSVDTIFKNAMRIKRWLDDVSVGCAKANIRVAWIAPSGLPCIQPYLQETSKTVSTDLQVLRIAQENAQKKINKRKQKAGLPPNFIHSLDASHMLFVAKRCLDQGLAFAAVHDSFWSHAADVDTMNRMIREEFVRLHSMPLLENFYTSLINRGIKPVSDIRPPPSVGDLDLSEVLRSAYFFN